MGRVENITGKEKMLVIGIFSLSTMFSNFFLPGTLKSCDCVVQRLEALSDLRQILDFEKFQMHLFVCSCSEGLHTFAWYFFLKRGFMLILGNGFDK